MTVPALNVQPLDTGTTFRSQVYHALKQAITEMDIYDHDREIRLDERQLSDKLGVSRTPIREALTLLEQEGFIRLQPRRGIFVVRKTKTEIIEISRKIGTFETSIEPYEDCCTVFTPKHPRLRPTLEEVEKAEAGLTGLDDMVARAAEGARLVVIDPGAY